MRELDYPRLIFYPNWSQPEPWVLDVIQVFERARMELDSNVVHRKSNEALAIVRAGLHDLGFLVEGGVKQSKIHRLVHFGEMGVADKSYSIDSYHPGLKLALEVESGRSLRGNAVYQDLIQTSLLVGIDYFALAVPQRYTFGLKGKSVTDAVYNGTKSIPDAIYSSDRLKIAAKRNPHCRVLTCGVHPQVKVWWESHLNIKSNLSRAAKPHQLEPTTTHPFLAITEKADGNYPSYSPDLPRCVVVGDTRQESERNVHEAVQLHLEGLVEDGLPIPKSHFSASYIAAP